MLSVDEARARIVGPLRPTAAEIVALPDAWGRVTAAPVLARLDQPPADVSAMDGYALARPRPGPRRVVGAAPAGHPFAGRVGAGEAVRLFTGSFVPEGADSVLIQEDATRDGDMIVANEAPVAGRHIRRRGQDFAAGDVLLPAGMRLNARAVGLGRGRQPPLAGRASPPDGRHPRHRRRDRHARRTDPARRHRQFQRACPRRPGSRPRRRAGDPAHRARPARGDRGRGGVGGRRRPAGHHRRRQRRRARPGPGRARAARLRAGFLEDRDAAGQAADLRPTRRDGRARPAGQPGLGAGLRHPVPGPGTRPPARACPATPQPARPPGSGRPSPPTITAPTTCAQRSPATRTAMQSQRRSRARTCPCCALLNEADALILRAPNAPALSAGDVVSVIRLGSSWDCRHGFGS